MSVFVCMDVLHQVCVCVVSVEIGRHQMPWSYGRLWGSVRLLATKPRSSAKSAHVLNCWAISPPLRWYPIEFHYAVMYSWVPHWTLKGVICVYVSSVLFPQCMRSCPESKRASVTWKTWFICWISESGIYYISVLKSWLMKRKGWHSVKISWYFYR